MLNSVPLKYLPEQPVDNKLCRLNSTTQVLVAHILPTWDPADTVWHQIFISNVTCLVNNDILLSALCNWREWSDLI